MSLRVGFVGWRGMVGSVLLERMQAENDFADIEAVFFSTSQAGHSEPAEAQGSVLLDAFDIEALQSVDVVVTCQGGDYTSEIHPKLRAKGWAGYWIDAASTLRMKDSSILILDPVNRAVIEAGLKTGKKDLIGANCTVSTMLMGLTGLFKSGEVEWVSAMTYQAASGAGSQAMKELLSQMRRIGEETAPLIAEPSQDILSIDRQVNQTLYSDTFPTEQFGAPLVASLLPWIDAESKNGQSREEWKAMVETNKILGTSGIAVDGTCVRIGAMRSHAHGLTIKLKRDISIDQIEQMVSSAHEWVTLVPNTKEASNRNLTSSAVSGSLSVHVGRLRKMSMGPTYLNAFTVGDQLLWGAAEPLRRMLRVLIDTNRV